MTDRNQTDEVAPPPNGGPRKLRVVIADDEPLARDLLRRMLSQRGDTDIVGEASSGEEALELLESLHPDIAFLDIQMPVLTGVDVVRTLPQPHPAIVFVTAYDAFAVEAFELRAVDYLVKPFDEERLADAITRVRSRPVDLTHVAAVIQALQRNNSAGAGRMYLTDGDRTVLRRFDQIDWIEADRKQLFVRSGGKKYVAPGPLQAVESRLDPTNFVRISRSVIVNLDRVVEIQPWFAGEFVLIMSDGARVHTSRGYRSRLDGILGRVPRRERSD